MMSSDSPDVQTRSPTAAELPDSFAFVANVGSLEVRSFELAAGHTLRRATTEEVGLIKVVLSSLGTPLLAHPLSSNLWESRWPIPEGRVELLPEADWRYYVVAFRGPNTTIGELRRAFDLAPTELEIPLTVVFSQYLDGPSYNWHPDRFFQLLRRGPYDSHFSLDLGSEQIADMVTIHDLLQRDTSELHLALSAQLSALKALPYDSPLR